MFECVCVGEEKNFKDGNYFVRHIFDHSSCKRICKAERLAAYSKPLEEVARESRLKFEGKEAKKYTTKS